MGTPVKLTLEGETVFVCCSGCAKKALANSAETLATVRKLRESHRDADAK
jgi:hypothetical protein